MKAIDIITGEETEVDVPKPKSSMMAWLASEGGRKCQWCGKYRKSSDLLDCMSHVGDNYAIDCAPMCSFCRKKYTAN